MRSKPRRGGPIPGARLSLLGEPPPVGLTIRVLPSMREEWRETAPRRLNRCQSLFVPNGSSKVRR